MPMTRKKRTVEFKVRIILPPGVTVACARSYIEEAVCSWKGSFRPPGGYNEVDPGDPLFDLDVRSVRVTRLKGVQIVG